MPCHYICGRTWTTDTSSTHWKVIRLGWSRPWCIVTNLCSCALEAYLLTNLLIYTPIKRAEWKVTDRECERDIQLASQTDSNYTHTHTRRNSQTPLQTAINHQAHLTVLLNCSALLLFTWSPEDHLKSSTTRLSSWSIWSWLLNSLVDGSSIHLETCNSNTCYLTRNKVKWSQCNWRCCAVGEICGCVPRRIVPHVPQTTCSYDHRPPRDQTRDAVTQSYLILTPSDQTRDAVTQSYLILTIVPHNEHTIRPVKQLHFTLTPCQQIHALWNSQPYDNCSICTILLYTYIFSHFYVCACFVYNCFVWLWFDNLY